MSDFAVGMRIARAETVRNWRRRVTGRRQIALFALVLVILVPLFLPVLMSVYEFGQTVARGANVPLVDAARHFVPLFLGGMIVMGAIQAVQSLGQLEGERMLLSTVSTRALVVGLLIKDVAQWLISIGLFLVLAMVPFALGLGAPMLSVVSVLAFIPLVAATLLVGYVLGFLVRLGVRKLPVSSSTKRVVEAGLGAVGFLAAAGMGAVVGGSGASGSLLNAVPEGPPAIPLGWYADLFFLGTPLQPSLSPMTGLAALGVLAAIPIAFGGLVRLAPQFWYAETRSSTASSSTDDSRTTDEETTRTGRQSEGVFQFRTVRIAHRFWHRAMRAPDRFVHLMYYVMLLSVLAPSLIADPGLAPVLLPAAMTLLGIWLAGSAFCLNPLGEEGSMLQEITLTPTPAATFVHARLLVGIALGAPIAVAGVVLLALGSDAGVVSLQQAVAGGILAIILAVVSAAFALGIGSFLPRSDTVRLFDSVEAPAPSTMAFAIHTVVTSLLALTGAAVVWGGTGETASGSVMLRWESLSVLALGIVIIGDGSRRYAIERLVSFGRSPDGRDRNRVLAAYIGIGLAVLGFVASMAAAVSLITVVPTFEIASGGALAVQFLVEYAGYAIIAVGFLYVTKRGIGYIDGGWPSRRDVGYALAGLGASLAIWFGLTRVALWFGLPMSGQSLLETVANTDPTLLLVLIPLVFLVNAPVEELFFRNLIQKSLSESFSHYGAILVGSLCFALVHVPAYYDANLTAMAVSLTVVFVLGCCWGVIYVRTERLFVPVVAHGTYNAVLLVVGYLSVV
jgi:membrane protease YdiL (CAAX protease family)